MGVSKEDVAEIAALARLRLEDGSVERLTSELNRILGYVELLQEVDVSGVDEEARITEGPLAFRDPGVERDQLAPGAPADRAPGWRDGFFSVPRPTALDGSGGGVDNP